MKSSKIFINGEYMLFKIQGVCTTLINFQHKMIHVWRSHKNGTQAINALCCGNFCVPEKKENFFVYIFVCMRKSFT